MAARKFGEIAVDEGFVSSEQMKEALEFQKKNGGKIGDVLIQLNLISTHQQDDILKIQMSDMM